MCRQGLSCVTANSKVFFVPPFTGRSQFYGFAGLKMADFSGTPKTANQRKANYRDEATKEIPRLQLRQNRSSHLLPHSWDKLSRHYERSWKDHRRTERKSARGRIVESTALPSRLCEGANHPPYYPSQRLVTPNMHQSCVRTLLSWTSFTLNFTSRNYAGNLLSRGCNASCG
jgi:hypothetical protein